jgi:hypothetical protein
LVCDFIELYRYLVDDFLIDYSQKLTPRDFKAKTEIFNEKKGERIYLKEKKNRELVSRLHDFFKKEINVPRIKRGNKQEIESLINEEAFQLAKYLRDKKGSWSPRIVELS